MVSSPIRARLEPIPTFLAGWPRRLAAVLCLALAALSAFGSDGRASSVDGVAVVVAARDLPAGTSPRLSDLRVARWPSALVPAGTIGEVAALANRSIAGPIARGEPVTQVRLLDTSLTASLRPGEVAATISLPGRAQAAILHPGTRIDVYMLPSASVLADGKPVSATASGRLVASDVRVLAVLADPDKTGQDDLSIVITADRVTASHLANQPSGPFLATLRPPS